MSAAATYQPPLREGESQVMIPGLAGQLEGILAEPAVAVAKMMLILHPHPQQGGGGSMHNKVVTSIAKAVGENFRTLRINFRGVGESQGEYGEGEGEFADAISALHWMRGQFPSTEIAVAGFSFGACVAYRLAYVMACQQLLCIAPPVFYPQMAVQLAPTCAIKLIAAAQDEVVDCSKIIEWKAQLQGQVSLSVLPDAGHFFHGQLTNLTTLIRKIVV